MTTAAALLEERVATWLATHVAEAQGLEVKAVIELTGEGGGRWLLDCSQHPPSFSKDSGTAAMTTISMTTKVFEQLASGSLSPEGAFLSGAVSVSGDLGMAIKLGKLLS